MSLDGVAGQPVLIDEGSSRPSTDRGPGARTLAWEPSRPTATGSAWAGTASGSVRRLPQRLARLVGHQPARAGAHIESPLFLAHVRAAIGSPVQQTNCHPFRHGRWLFVHNGFIADMHRLRRDLMLAVDPSMFADVQGSTDTRVVFHLALTLGLEDGPIEALERTVGMIEAIARRHGVADAVQASFGVSDGTSLWAVRYATTGRPRSLFASAEADAIRRLHPDNPRFQRLGHDDRLIVSEPFSISPASGRRFPEATAVTVRRGGVLEERPFRPRTPSAASPRTSLSSPDA